MENQNYVHNGCPVEILFIDPRYPKFCKIRYFYKGIEKIEFVPYRTLKKI